MKLIDHDAFNQQMGIQFQFVVPELQSKIRLDKFLTSKLEKISRSQIKNLINDANVTVNGKSVKASHLLLPNEVIVVTIPPPPKVETLKEDIPLDIVYEDKYVIVINKKAGVVVHPAYGNTTGTLVNALLFHFEQLSNINGLNRPGIVHRLDKDTSGLLVIAKDDYTHQHLSSQFSERTIQREYIAFVWGDLKENKGRIESHIIRSNRDRTKMVASSKGKLAATNYEVIEKFPLVSMLSIKLETGRTHQIRVHFSSIGHPVVGDQTYGGRQKQIINLNQAAQRYAIDLLKRISRQALHAKKLGFLHPMTKEFLIFDSDLPDDMMMLKEYLHKFKSSFDSL